MPEMPTPEESETKPRIITDGYFEEELYIDAKSAGEFLIELGEQLRDKDEITLQGDGWELPFAFGGPVELEIEFEGSGDRELEIEVELRGRVESDKAPSLA